MESWLAYTLVDAFMLFQAFPLILAFRGKPRAWIFTQAGFGIAMFALASVQNSGRGSWALMAATTVAIIATSALSALLALIGYHWRARRPRIANSEAA